MNTRKTPLLAAVTALGLCLSACGGGGGSSSGSVPGVGGASGGGTGGSSGSAPPPTAASKSLIETEIDAVRFLAQASFGGSQSEIDALQGTDAADWVASEFAKSASLTLPDLLNEPTQSNGRRSSNSATYLYWDHLANSDDELRQRMALALSQILVYSDAGSTNQPERRAFYQDILIRNAFGNYRDLLQEVTYSPAMGRWLTYHRNRKGDARKGRMPDENYAREVLQLFTIGLVELNMDGTSKLDAQGAEIETYDNDDIIGLARVFTGLSDKGSAFYKAADDANYNPMVMYEDQHSPLEKVFLGTTIPADTPGDETISRALDTIFEHPNLAPFVSRQLIQRFTESNPDPRYVGRVAQAFETGSFVAENGRRFGGGERGDLEATLAAILLDETLFVRDTGTTGMAQSGKVREPILRFMHWVEAFDVSGIDAENERRLRDTRDPVTGLGQQPFRSPSVFNFYRPGYVAPGTASGDAGLTVPEFQIVNSSSSVGYLNFMSQFAFDRSSQRENDRRTYIADYTDELAMLDNFPGLLTHLDDLLTGGRMSEREREEIVAVLEVLPINTSTPEREEADRLQIVQTAVSLVLNSPAYAVTW